MFEKKALRKLVSVYLDQDHIDSITCIRKYDPSVTAASVIREALTRGLRSVKKEVNK